MNLLDAKVTRVLGEPEYNYGKWWVKVAYDCWGREGETKLMFDTETEARNVKVGHEFLT